MLRKNYLAKQKLLADMESFDLHQVNCYSESDRALVGNPDISPKHVCVRQARLSPSELKPTVALHGRASFRESAKESSYIPP